MTWSSDWTAAIGESARDRTRPFVVAACSPTGKLLLPKRYHDPGTAGRVAFMLASAGFGVSVARGKEDDSVLKISSATEADSLVTLKVEGALVGDWVPLLEAECLCHLDARKLVELDFAGVSFVDRDGVAMVRGLVATGVQVLGATALVNALLGRSGAP
jgi:hypothetical protein